MLSVILLVALFGVLAQHELCLLVSALTIWCDNLSAINLAQNPVFLSCAKHIELDMHFIGQRVLYNESQISYIPFSEQVVDILTKHMHAIPFSLLRTKLSVLSTVVSLRGMIAKQTFPF